MMDVRTECATAGGRDTGGALLENTAGIVTRFPAQENQICTFVTRNILSLEPQRHRNTKEYVEDVHHRRVLVQVEKETISKKRLKVFFYVLHFRIDKLNLS